MNPRNPGTLIQEEAENSFTEDDPALVSAISESCNYLISQ